MAIASSSEDRLIAWLRAEITRRGLPDLLGDDVAHLKLDGNWAVSTDQQIEGTHFRTGLHPSRIGRRLVAVNLSDLAAAGVRPGYALAAVAAPRGFDFKSFFRGLLDACSEHGLKLAGGDLATADRSSFKLTVFGRRPSRGSRLGRDRARPGDVLWLGGPVGAAALGRRLLDTGATATARTIRLPAQIPRRLRGPARWAIERFLEPRPQLALGSWLARRRRAATIDISDGLLLDLERMARASGVACELRSEAIPGGPGFSELAAWIGTDPLEAQCAGGEDYVLLFALPSGARPPSRFGAAAIGRVLASSGSSSRAIVRVEGSGRRAIRNRGWDHLRHD